MEDSGMESVRQIILYMIIRTPKDSTKEILNRYMFIKAFIHIKICVQTMTSITVLFVGGSPACHLRRSNKGCFLDSVQTLGCN